MVLYMETARINIIRQLVQINRSVYDEIVGPLHSISASNNYKSVEKLLNEAIDILRQTEDYGEYDAE